MPQMRRELSVSPNSLMLLVFLKISSTLMRRKADDVFANKFHRL